MARELHDHFFRQAKRDGYRSRAAYKLIEIDERRHVLARGSRVLDCGAAPGSWLQVTARRVGPRGLVVGIDLRRVEPVGPNVHLVTGDLREVGDDVLLAPLGGGDARFDVVLSDMAPDTTGDRTIDHHGSVRLVDEVLARAATLLRPGGDLVAKVFEGAAYADLLARFRASFDAVKGFQPKASRSASTEIYVIARGRKTGTP